MNECFQYVCLEAGSNYIISLRAKNKMGEGERVYEYVTIVDKSKCINLGIIYNYY